MVRCDVCGKEDALPYRCAYCGGSFCDEHRLPGSHYCQQRIQTAKRNIVFREVRDPNPSEEASTRTNVHKKSSSALKVVLTFLLIGSIALNLYLWDFRYSQGYDDGYSEGSTTGFQHGQSEGYRLGYEKGNSTGYHSGHDMGYDLGYVDGLSLGNESGYVEGYGRGFDGGNETGYGHGHNVGSEEGYDDGYLQGVEDGAGRGYTIRDPAYKEALRFVRTDDTDRFKYDPDNFVCHDFAAIFKTNAFKAGLKCFFVYLEFPEGNAHALVAFNTTDKGLIFVEPQTDDLVTIEIGQRFWDRDKYIVEHDDTVLDFNLIP